MAMRPRGGRGNPARGPRPIIDRVYESFKPMSEWRQGDDYDTLLVYLPGFQKEYIKVTIEDLNIIRVRGERLVAGNKWSRFQEDFRVPEKCEMIGVRARFDGGILTITMPRKIIITPPPPPTTTQVAPKSEEQETLTRRKQEETLVQKPKDHQDPKEKATSRSEEPPLRGRKQEETLIQKPKDYQDSKEKATSSNESEKKPGKPQTPLEGSTSTLPPPPPISQPTPTKQEPSKTAVFKFGSLPSSVPKKDKDDGGDEKGKSKEPVVGEEKKMGLESRKGESEGGQVAENAVVRGGNGWRGLNEDRKMVVNVGVAVLVIVALGFHVSYTISKRD